MGERRLTQADIEAIAERTAELLIDRIDPPGRYLDTAGVARMLNVAEDWVRDHAAELGGVRVGDGPRGALRFERRRVEQAMEARRLDPPPKARRRRRPGPRPRTSDVELLPLPERRL